MNSSEVISYLGANEKNIQVQLTYGIESKIFDIIIVKAE